jgi:hypothetical protein
VSLKGLDAKTKWLVVNRQTESNFDFVYELAVGQSLAGKNVSAEAEGTVGIRHQAKTEKI